MEEIIASKLGRNVQIERRPVKHNVIVVTGKFCLLSPTSAPKDGLVHLYSTDGEPDAGEGRWTPNTINNFVRMLSHRTKMVVLDQTEPAEQKDDFFFYEHQSAWLRDIKDTREKEYHLRLLLDRLEAQTQLKFEIREELLPTWCIAERAVR